MISSIPGLPYQIGSIVSSLHSGHIISIFYHKILALGRSLLYNRYVSIDFTHNTTVYLIPNVKEKRALCQRSTPFHPVSSVTQQKDF
jgi:hypothetical protein